jgi:hypothetical protein
MSPSIADDFPAIAAAINAPEADTSDSDTQKPEWALVEIEPALYELRANIGILGHLAMSDNEVTKDEWQYVEGNLITIHRRLDALWTTVWEQQKAQKQEHVEALAAAEEELAEAKAQAAAPGSAADIEHAEFLWRMLRRVAAVTLEECDEAIDEGKADMSAP